MGGTAKLHTRGNALAKRNGVRPPTPASLQFSARINGRCLPLRGDGHADELRRQPAAQRTSVYAAPKRKGESCKGPDHGWGTDNVIQRHSHHSNSLTGISVWSITSQNSFEQTVTRQSATGRRPRCTPHPAMRNKVGDAGIHPRGGRKQQLNSKTLFLGSKHA